jgi:hypothetical protein
MQWLRLYHDTTTDKKWSLVSADSGQPVGVILGVWMEMLICASEATERGTLEGWDDRIIAAHLGFRTDQVAAIREAMQGLVLDGMRLTGWDKRQRQASDDAADRKRRSRANKRPENPPDGGHGSNGLDQDVTGQSRDNTAHSHVTMPECPVTPSRATQTPDLQKVTEDEEDAGARAVVIHVAQQVAAMAGFVGPVDERPDLSIVAVWLKEGADPDVDIIPAVAIAMHRTTQVRIRTFGYFTDEVRQHHAARINPKPEKSNVLPIRSPAQQRRGHSGRATGSAAQVRLVAREFEIGDFDADGSGVWAG